MISELFSYIFAGWIPLLVLIAFVYICTGTSLFGKRSWLKGVILAVVSFVGVRMLPFWLFEGHLVALWLPIVGLVLALGGFILLFTPFGGETFKTSESRKTQATRQRLAELSQQYGIPELREPNGEYQPWWGYAMVDADAGGQEEPVQSATWHVDPMSERFASRRYGTPGFGLTGSNFRQQDADRGIEGERILAKIILGSQQPVLSFWSLYGFDRNGNKVDADIDCMLLGVTRTGQVKVWIVDAKHYAGGSDRIYTQFDTNTLIGVSEAKHALVAFQDGKPLRTMSGNMGNQAKLWHDRFAQYGADENWRVCMIGGRQGTPRVNELNWPGGVRAVTVGELLREINASNLDPNPEQLIGTPIFNLIVGQVKTPKPEETYVNAA